MFAVIVIVFAIGEKGIFSADTPVTFLLVVQFPAVRQTGRIIDFNQNTEKED